MKFLFILSYLDLLNQENNFSAKDLHEMSAGEEVPETLIAVQVILNLILFPLAEASRSSFSAYFISLRLFLFTFMHITVQMDKLDISDFHESCSL